MCNSTCRMSRYIAHKTAWRVSGVAEQRVCCTLMVGGETSIQRGAACLPICHISSGKSATSIETKCQTRLTYGAQRRFRMKDLACRNSTTVEETRCISMLYQCC